MVSSPRVELSCSTVLGKAGLLMWDVEGNLLILARSPRQVTPAGRVVRHGADDGNRTRMASLEGWGSAIELHPRDAQAPGTTLAEQSGPLHLHREQRLGRDAPDPQETPRTSPLQTRSRFVADQHSAPTEFATIPGDSPYCGHFR